MITRLVIVLLLFGVAHAAVADDEAAWFGLLRARDLTPFGFLRLDMRPAHAVSLPKGSWAIETELAYQNTWAVSSGVQHYLDSLETRHDLGPQDAQAIDNLSGENYLVDLELAELDVTFHYKFANHWGAYLIMSGVSYSGGFLDSTIESFHRTFNFPDFGRKGARQNDVNIIFNLKSEQLALFDAPTDGGLLDPTIGIRYADLELPRSWKLVVEAAAKIPWQGERAFLSTGQTDVGMQITVQHFATNYALYASGAGVYYDGSSSIPPTPAQVVPTLLLGCEWRLTGNTHLVLQGYASPSVYSREQTDLDELLSNKYQLTVGFYHRMGAGVLGFGFTENLRNFNNTPDVGFQVGWAYSPALRAKAQ